MKYFLIMCITFCLFSCRREACSYEPISFVKREVPPIRVYGQSDDLCSFPLEFAYWIDSVSFFSKGRIVFGEDSILLDVDSLQDQPIKYFDFSKPVGQHYTIKLYPKNGERKADLRVYIESIVRRRGKDVYIFRVLNGYSYDVYRADIVFFVTKKNGVIGSYCSAFEKGEEVYFNTNGDILRDVINYDGKRSVWLGIISEKVQSLSHAEQALFVLSSRC